MTCDRIPSATNLPRRAALLVVAMVFACVVVSSMQSQIYAQADSQINVAETQDEITNNSVASPIATSSEPDASRLNLLDLIVKGGVLMIPIVLMSVLVIALVLERTMNLREKKILPRGLVHELGVLAATKNEFDPKQAYRVCQSFPSSASTVIRSMLLKVGRPQSEVERAVAEASDREASRLYSNVRWLNLVAAVAPLIGLFGTVWGMIQAFFETTQLTAGQNKSVYLAAGIYVALVTTLGGLAVAIPAAISSHYFEGRIQKLFYQIDELLFNLMPQIERFEGRLRMNKRDFGSGGNGDSAPSQQQAAPLKKQPIRPSAPQQ